MNVDVHQHVFWHGRDDRGLIADLDAHGIDLAWLLTWEIPAEEDSLNDHRALNPRHLRGDGTHAGVPLSDVLIARDRYPERFVVGYCPCPYKGDAPALLEAAHRMHGARVCGEWKYQVLLDDPRCLNLFRKAGELEMPVVLHLDVAYRPDEAGRRTYDPRWCGGTVENLARALAACPETVFLGHGPGFWREISGDADQDPAVYPEGPLEPGGRLDDLFEEYGSLYGDLSAGSGLYALRRDPAHAREFLTRFADQMLFGRDNYGLELHEFLGALELDEDVREKIYFRNALRLVPSDGRADS